MIDIIVVDEAKVWVAGVVAGVECYGLCGGSQRGCFNAQEDYVDVPVSSLPLDPAMSVSQQCHGSGIYCSQVAQEPTGTPRSAV